MIDVNALRKGVTFEMDGSLYKVLDYTHHKPGRGKATIRTKIRDLRTGSIIEKTFSSGDRVQDVALDHHKVQYLYTDGDFYHFMDLETYDQPAIRADIIGDMSYYLTEEMVVKLTLYENAPLDIEIPLTVEQEIVEAEPAVRGDTATGLTIKVKTVTGLELQTPAFIKAGDTIRVDTRTGTYVTRV